MKKFTPREVNSFGHGIEIVPAILEQSKEEVQKKLNLVDDKVERVQVDILDGIFADNLTIAPADLIEMEFGDSAVDVHLMTEYPHEYLGDLHSAGVSRVFAQIERMNSQSDFIESCEELDLLPGLAVDLYTPVDSMEIDLERLDGILLMSVKAGHAGQKFSELVLPKISKLREVGYNGDIQVDGGVNPETVKRCFEVGANQFCENSSLWKANTLEDGMNHLKSLIGDGLDEPINTKG